MKFKGKNHHHYLTGFFFIILFKYIKNLNFYFIFLYTFNKLCMCVCVRVCIEIIKCMYFFSYIKYFWNYSYKLYMHVCITITYVAVMNNWLKCINYIKYIWNMKINNEKYNLCTINISIEQKAKDTGVFFF